MKTRLRRAPVLATASLVLLLALGFGVATQVGTFLGISVDPVEAAPEDPQAAPAREAVAPTVGRVELPAKTPHRVDVAAAALDESLDGARGTLTVATDADLGPDASDEAFRVTADGDDLTLESASEAGAAAGLYQLADRARTGRDLAPSALDGRNQQPDLPLRLVDKGAAAVDDSEEGWRTGDEYSHNSGQFADAILSDAPYVDTDALAEDAEEFKAYVDRQLAQGYNGIVLPGFLEYVTFDQLDDEIYDDGDSHVQRAMAMREHFGPLWRYAHDMGMKVFLSTDMLALSTPLENYLDAHDLDTEDPELWDVYGAGLAEFFEAMPYVDGLLTRIGEGGGIYALPGWDYWSEIAVTTPTAVRAMLDSFTTVAEQQDREIIFRTWSVGVGAVGDLHTNPESYESVLGDVESDALIVSTKHVAGDFYSYLPLNETLEVGHHRRIVEMQARREFEGFGALPNDLTSAYSEALAHLRQANPNIEGVWSWAQEGGPVRASPQTLFLRKGFWQLWDVNSYAAARLAWDTSADPAEITADWARETFSDDPETVNAIGEAMAMSRDAIVDGLYIEPFAEQYVRAMGLEIPTQTWLFEWDIVTGDSGVLDSIYSISRDRLGGSIAGALDGGQDAIDTTEKMRALVDATDPDTWRDAGLRQEFLDSLDYQLDLFTVLNDYRAMTMYHAQWLDTGSSEAADGWHEARDAFTESRRVHVDTYGDDLQRPAFEFTAADLGAERADRDPVMAWIARILLVLTIAALVLIRPLRVAVTRPWRLGALLRTWQPSTLDRLLVVAAPLTVLVLSRLTLTWFAAPSHVVLTVGAWLLFGFALRLTIGRRDPFAVWAVIGGVVLVRTAILLFALSSRGPGRYWFVFWTEPTGRALYITVAFAAFGWLFVAAALALRSAYGVTRRGAVGRVLLAMAAPLVVGGVAIGLIGTEQALTTWNDQMALIPWGLARILGITTHLGIPTALPWYAVVAGGGLALIGLVLTGRRFNVSETRS